VVFVLVDAVLVAIALNRDDAVDAQVAAPIPTFGSSSTPKPTPSPSVAPAPEAAPRFLVAQTEMVGWRATRGGCAGIDSIVESTEDGGVTWEPLSPPELHQLVGMSSTSTSTVRLLGRAGSSCAVGSFASFTGGQFWNFYPGSTGEFVFLDPANPMAIHSDGDNLLAPCSANEVHTRGDAIAAGCDDQFLERDGTTGAWLSVATPGLLAFSPSDTGYTLALAGVDGCPGVSVQSLVSPIGSVPPITLGCLVEETTPTEVTLATVGSTVWLWSGDRFVVSSDSGVTWP
jgi:hypothetical protein